MTPAAELRHLDPQPDPAELSSQFPSPFDHRGPVPLARRAAEALQAALPAELRGLGLDLDRPGSGKMFGVLVVADGAGHLSYLRAFSGMLGGQWHVPGFAPPLFDAEARAAFWPAAEAELAALDARHRELSDGEEPRALRAELSALDERHARALDELRRRHRANRGHRRDRRRALADDDAAAAHELDQASRADAAERRRLLAHQREERTDLAERLARIDDARRALEQHRAARSRGFQHRIHASYVVQNARGERADLATLFGDAGPPSGAGDCAAPKLLGRAYALGLRPLALAELWWGAPPASGGRRHGHFYPACRGKCGPILPFMLQGLDVAAAPLAGARTVDDAEPRVLFEDRWLLVVDKPAGLLSVPGRNAQLRDSVLVRLRRRYPAARGPLLVHRLDLDTSGLLLAAKDPDTHAALQRLFARRDIDKRYVAWLDGDVAGDRGLIDLPLRVDLDDRPRQIHDPVHGKPALTEWHVLERRGARTRVALYPRTGRTHQLRVHAAHHQGLDAPITGDRLYGRAAERLLLHAEALRLLHPHTGATIELERPAPF